MSDDDSENGKAKCMSKLANLQLWEPVKTITVGFVSWDLEQTGIQLWVYHRNGTKAEVRWVKFFKILNSF
jgi:hypothetical protein